MIRLRFVHCPSIVGDAILLKTGGRFSHVEAVTPEGLYLGAHANGGVLARPSDYDRCQWSRQLFYVLPADDATTAKFYHYLNAVVGEPYSFSAIAQFITDVNITQSHHVICSALQMLALRGCEWYPTPLAYPAHEISPRDAMLLLSGRVPVPQELYPPQTGAT